VKQKLLTTFKIDYSSAVPVYEQVKKHIKQAVAKRMLLEDQLLPSQRELASLMKINPNTIARSYRELVREGIISGRTGKGYRVKFYPGMEEEKRKLLEEKFLFFLEEAVEMGFPAKEIKDIIDRILKGKTR
jgi:GntR family transcriptional regulator